MKLTRILPKKSGRSKGTVTVRHQGGRAKRFLRDIDWKRDKQAIEAMVEEISYDPNRSADIASVVYADGERRYILSPLGLSLGQKVISGKGSPLNLGNAIPLSEIPIGTAIHAIEIRPGKGAQVVKSAGSSATIFGKEENWVLIKLPSGQVKRFEPTSLATIGQLGNIENKNKKIGKAGRKRWMGIRPTVRGTAQNPRSHPHGGGSGKSGVGMKYPKTPWGKKAVGKTRNKNKYSDHLIFKGSI
ncbi:MAG: 50S ribosomal protein L2 [Patescibacteria group bacterium]